jgi:hypothetical protein
VMGRDSVLDRHVGEQRATALLLTSHHDWGSCPIVAEVAGFFSELLGPAALQEAVSIRFNKK